MQPTASYYIHTPSLLRFNVLLGHRRTLPIAVDQAHRTRTTMADLPPAPTASAPEVLADPVIYAFGENCYRRTIASFKTDYLRQRAESGQPTSAGNAGTSGPLLKRKLTHEDDGDTSTTTVDTAPVTADPFAHVTSLRIFDFDNTLFASPVPNRRLWDNKLVGALMSPTLGWFHDPRTLTPPYVRAHIGDFCAPVLADARASLRQSNTLTVMMTGRGAPKFTEPIDRILAVADLQFDMKFLKETPPCVVNPDPKNALVAASSSPVADFDLVAPTLTYKLHVMNLLLQEFPAVRELLIWEDRSHHKLRFQKFVEDLIARGRLQTGGTPDFVPRHGSMASDLEYDLVQRTVDEYNARQKALLIPPAPSHGPEADLHRNLSASLIGGDSPSLTLPFVAVGSPSASVTSSPAPHHPAITLYELRTGVSQTFINLSRESQSRLFGLHPLSPAWTRRPFTARFYPGQLPDDLAQFLTPSLTHRRGRLGQFPLRIAVIRLGQVEGRGLLAEFDLPTPLLNAHFHGEAPCLAVAYTGNLGDLYRARATAQWETLPEPVPLDVRLTEETRTTLYDPAAEAAAAAARGPPQVRLGRLIKKWHPRIQGKPMGQAIRVVTAHLSEQNLTLDLENGEVIEAIIKVFSFSDEDLNGTPAG
ncbi:hypothetical protein IWQ60_002198 [Tieghemiomyces parasiticus]|uniref:Swiss Army Knife RNA repair protein HAD domain-containing protein n=1 Tax=Tieghemiomyces parasiticus TaxID=78921 RepID=A0A9W8DVX4_9FUNG|nr:hypothetical protein IWQ60_002198 [Tieghemiomyces parasiticus]